MQNQELCILLDSLLALLETNNTEKAKEVIQNAIKRIDKATSAGVIKKNTSSRQKSRLSKKVNAME